MERTLRRLQLEEKIGQMIMARAYGTYFSIASDSYERLDHLVRRLKVGGFVFFRGDVYETAVLVNRLQSTAEVPLLIAADMERGVAMRVRRATLFPDAMALGATRDTGLAERMGEVIAQEGRALGVHQNYAPVLDLNNNPKNPVINVRSFGEDPTLVSRLTIALIHGLQKGGVVATVKHFPGHGDTEIDSHLGLPVLSFTRGRLDSLELVPFKQAISAGVSSIMIAHLALPNVDTTGIPATLSPVVVQQLLRSDLHFNGLIVTDALEMAAVVNQFSVAEIAVRAVKAGSDMLLLPADEEHSIRAIAAAVRRGEISESRIDESVRRILSTKAALGLPEHRQVDLRLIPEVVGTRDHLALAKDIARRSITIVKNDSSMIPLQVRSLSRTACVVVSDAEDYRTEVNRASNPYQDERVGDYFIAQLRSRTGPLDTYRVDSKSDRTDFDSVLAAVRSADLFVCPTYVRLRTGTGKIGLPDSLKAFLQSLAALGKPVVLVSLGNPYVIADVPGARSLICAYS
ncbi:MAG TPA: glycoside hydrolase family 3 protein, partial [Bacteroidota bacterium]